MTLIHVISVGGLFPNGKQTFVVERTGFVDTSQCLIGLTAAWVVMTYKQPQELPADAVFYALCQTDFLSEQFTVWLPMVRQAPYSPLSNCSGRFISLP